jgi:DNA-binding NarL/FixJ family response regulator
MNDKPLKILSIDEDDFMRIFIRDVFWIHGGSQDELYVFGNVKKAKEFLEKPENKPNLIFMGLGLPEEDGGKQDVENGFRFLKELKSNPETKNIKVIVFSHFADKEIKKKALELGACNFLVKGEHMPQDILRIIKETAAGKSECN